MVLNVVFVFEAHTCAFESKTMNGVNTSEQSEVHQGGNHGNCCSHGNYHSWKTEIIQLFKLGWPTVLFTLATGALATINLMFCGRVDKETLAGAALGLSFSNVTGVCVAHGFGSACDTLFSQTFGSENKKYVGVVLQRSLLIMGIGCILIWVLYVNVEYILIGFQIDREVARGATTYVHVFMTGVPVSWSYECLNDWDVYVKISLAGILMIASEWWAFEVGTFLMGTVGDTELAAQGAVFGLAYFFYTIPLGYSEAISIRVGNTLGANEPHKARRVAIVGVISMIISSVLFAIIIIASRDVIGLLYTSEREVVVMIAQVAPLMAVYQIFDAIGMASLGALQGCGLQKVIAIVNCVLYYIVCLPIMFVLVLVYHMGILGVWIPLVIVLVCKGLLLVFVVFRLNWQKQADKAQERANVNRDNTSDSVPQFVGVNMDQIKIEHKNSYTQTGLPTSAEVTIVPSDNYSSNNGRNSTYSFVEQNMEQTNQPSLKTLIWRRIFTLLFALTLLGISVAVQFLVVIPPISDPINNCFSANMTDSMYNISIINGTNICNDTLT
uniref:Multidrug and toxin extrusion protein n=1 Tax=Saccoglossus kowalevskii TaxID=10224 RepID=A0ABM0ML46_SACKO|nr:PREDICTED: multidrug and toxin extrusion protein 1-like [Saccoglossus kowalevskii]